MNIALETPMQTEVVELIDALDAFQKPLYPEHSHHGVEITELAADHVLFAVARAGDGEAIGCAAIVLGTGHGELKRFYTKPAHRGKGVAQALLAFLEASARRAGCTCFVLETGYLQQDAIRFYAAHGYVQCGPFGDYVDDPNSIFMRKLCR